MAKPCFCTVWSKGISELCPVVKITGILGFEKEYCIGAATVPIQHTRNGGLSFPRAAEPAGEPDGWRNIRQDLR